MKSDHELEVKIRALTIPMNRWCWRTKLNGLDISSLDFPDGSKYQMSYTTPRGAKEAFKRWLEGADRIIWRIYRHSYHEPGIDIKFKVEGE
jgi:hypothetical protein